MDAMTPTDGLRQARELAGDSADHVLSFAADDRNGDTIRQALRVRAVESALLDLFGKGKLHGTIHTCVGQELTGVVIGGKLREGDFITSNHRCHGHFIGATGNWRGLIDEIIGNADGVCAGIGSSQHLYARNFMSNGQQGGLLPVAAGIALDRKRRAQGGIVVSFIGEGTLGEGVLYETMNIASLWSLPHVIVCENNFYSQSTPQPFSVAGNIGARAAAFGITVREANTWSPDELDIAVEDALTLARAESRPVFLVVKTYRLNPHSKGDDQRDADEIGWFNTHDPLNIILREHNTYRAQYELVRAEVDRYAAAALEKPKLTAASYFVDQLSRRETSRWERRAPPTHDLRIVQQLNQFYGAYLRSDPRVYFLGEDIADPYGGAFKVSKGLETEFPDRVITTPISEGAVSGVGVGLAVAGNRPLIEIMFGDFMTLTFDQVVNNAAKFFHMYNRQLSCPVVLRTPMGGRRGYGPTHSQSLERFFVGIDNTVVVSLHSLIDVQDQLACLATLSGPAIVFENKVDYTLRPYQPPSGFVIDVGNTEFPTVAIRPERTPPDVTIVSYGGMARIIADNLLAIFDELDLIPELIVPSSLHPLDITPIRQAVVATRRLAIVEEGALFAGAGAEIAAQIAQSAEVPVRIVRVGGMAMPVPSVPALEDVALPSIDRICADLRALHG